MNKYETWDYKESCPNPISADHGTIDNRFHRDEIVVQAPSANDLLSAMEWLALYDAGEDSDVRVQALANVIAFLDMTAISKINRASLNEAKRIYAQQNGVKFNQVRKIKKG